MTTYDSNKALQYMLNANTCPLGEDCKDYDPTCCDAEEIFKGCTTYQHVVEGIQRHIEESRQGIDVEVADAQAEGPLFRR